MKIFKVDFTPMWPVGCGLIIAAESLEQATQIAKESIKHTKDMTIIEVDISTPCVVYYDSGNY